MLYGYLLKGDIYPHVSIVIGSLSLFFETYNLPKQFKELKTFVKNNRKHFGRDITYQIVEVRNYLLQKIPDLVDDDDLQQRLNQLKKH